MKRSCLENILIWTFLSLITAGLFIFAKHAVIEWFLLLGFLWLGGKVLGWLTQEES